jgi:hypothetical protein
VSNWPSGSIFFSAIYVQADICSDIFIIIKFRLVTGCCLPLIKKDVANITLQEWRGPNLNANAAFCNIAGDHLSPLISANSFNDSGRLPGGMMMMMRLKLRSPRGQRPSRKSPRHRSRLFGHSISSTPHVYQLLITSPLLAPAPPKCPSSPATATAHPLPIPPRPPRRASAPVGSHAHWRTSAMEAPSPRSTSRRCTHPRTRTHASTHTPSRARARAHRRRGHSQHNQSEHTAARNSARPHPRAPSPRQPAPWPTSSLIQACPANLISLAEACPA